MRVLKNSGVKPAPGNKGKKKSGILLHGGEAAVQQNTLKKPF